MAVIGIACLLPVSMAWAQAIDYDAFEQLFGEPITGSATGKPQRVSRVPANMEIITADDIRRSGADNIPDILQFVAGLNVRRYGFAAADVSVRGYNETSNPRLLVLLNGQQVYLDDLGRTQWYTLPVELAEIRQIEVVMGPSTALFGFNAASGVINIITYDPMHESVNIVTASGGTQGYTSLSAVGTGRIADVGGVRVSAGGFQAHEFSPSGVSADDLAFRSSPRRRAVSLNAHVTVAPGIDFFAFWSAVETTIWEATSSPYYGTDYQRTNWSRVGATAETDIGLLGLSIYRNELNYTYYGASEREDLHDTVVVVQASDLVKLGSDHTVRIGLDYRNNRANSSGVLAGNVGYEVFSGSVMWDWQLTPSVSFTNAVRYDHFVLNQQGFLLPEVGFQASAYNGRTINEPSFNSGLVWTATDQDTFRLLAARGLQLPSIYDLGLQDRQPPGADGQGYLFLGQPRVNAASVSNVELDWDRAVPALLSTLRTSVFAQRTDNILTNPYEATPLGDGVLLNGCEELRAVAANVGRSSAVGGEIGVRGHAPSGLRWNASYSYISISDSLSINKAGIFSPQDFQHGTPTHVVVLGGGYTTGRWEFDAQARWQSQFLDYRANPADVTLERVMVPNYVTMNARVGYRLEENITVALSAQQFNLSHLRVSSGPPIERRLFLSISAHL
jgi:iron complex outermembrane receptor protein